MEFRVFWVSFRILFLLLIRAKISWLSGLGFDGVFLNKDEDKQYFIVWRRNFVASSSSSRMCCSVRLFWIWIVFGEEGWFGFCNKWRIGVFGISFRILFSLLMRAKISWGSGLGFAGMFLNNEDKEDFIVWEEFSQIFLGFGCLEGLWDLIWIWFS